MTAQKKTARLAGCIYLVVVLTGIFSLAYVPSKLVSWTDAAQTFQNIASSQSLFRSSIAGSMLCYTAFLLLPLVLYRLLHAVDGTSAVAMVAFAVVSVPVSFINLQHKFAVLALVDGAGNTGAPAAQPLQSQVMALLGNYDAGILIVQIFWGLWLFPFGYLVYRSGFLPKVLGVLLMLGCLGYLVNVFGRTLLPDFGQLPVARFVTLPASIGEIGTCLWLLVFGIKDKSERERSGAGVSPAAS